MPSNPLAFRETWSVEGEPVFYRPNLGSIGEKKYKSGDPLVVENHVRALDYGWADLAIVSCKYTNYSLDIEYTPLST